VSVPGYARNGFIVLGDALSTANLIRIGVGFGTGALSITETAGNVGTTNTTASIAAGATNNFRVDYAAATRTLTLRFGTNSVSRVLTGTYGDLDYGGYAIQSATLTRFSTVTLYDFKRAPGGSPSWTRLQIARDYTPGTYDTNGNFLGGTELMSLVSHKGRLYAGIGYWNDVFFGAGTNDPYPGPQVLVKEAWNAPWKQDFAAGMAFLRIENLSSVTFTTDKNGAPLNPPVTLLLAGSGEMAPPYGSSTQRRPVVWVRNDTTGTWTPTYPGPASTGSKSTRTIVTHVDKVTGVHHIFCGYGDANNRFVRGGYNATTGLIDWESTAELSGTERMLSAGVCNGVLYACTGSDGNLTNNIGGVFWREDGPVPKWNFVHEWPTNTRNPDIRGFTAVPHPKGLGYDVAIVTLESFGKVYCLDPIGGDPRNGHTVTEELEIPQFFGDLWNNGANIGFPALSAYNDMPELTDPATGEPVRAIGLWVNHPAGAGNPLYQNSWFLLRHANATYEHGQVIDPAFPLPTYRLRGCRAIRLSPFPEDQGRVLYLGGFDAASQTGAIYHNTAWLYRAELPDEQPTPVSPNSFQTRVSIETAHGWNYQLLASTNLATWTTNPVVFPGSNSVLTVTTNTSNLERQFYRWRIWR
jgi:hypothetical protein